MLNTPGEVKPPQQLYSSECSIAESLFWKGSTYLSKKYFEATVFRRGEINQEAVLIVINTERFTQAKMRFYAKNSNDAGYVWFKERMHKRYQGPITFLTTQTLQQ